MANSCPFLVNGPADSLATIVLAHGAGAPMDSDFMNYMALGLASENLKVVRFEFPYMSERRLGGSKRPPNPASTLMSCWRSVAKEVANYDTLFIGGKSLGGRIASTLADELSVRGLIVLGYPFHPQGKPHKTRTSHLETLKTPSLILQGERDPLGNMTDVCNYNLSSAIRIRWLPDGDHSFRPRKKSGHTEEQNRETAVTEITLFVRKIMDSQNKQ